MQYPWAHSKAVNSTPMQPLTRAALVPSLAKKEGQTGESQRMALCIADYPTLLVTA